MISGSMVALVQRLAAVGRITAEEALNVRRAIYPDGTVSRQEADALFKLNDRVGANDLVWNACFIEAICDHLLLDHPLRGHVTDEGAEWLENQIVRDGIVQRVTELELVLKLLGKAESCPDRLSVLARRLVFQAVLEGHGYEGRPASLVPGQIGDAELLMIRDVLFAAAGSGGIAVTREEAEWLFALDEATAGKAHVAGWRDMFVSAIMNHLFAVGQSNLLDRDAMMWRAQWLNGPRGGIGEFLQRAVGAGYGANIRHGSAMAGQFAHVHAREVEAQVADALEAREASWLLKRIEADGRRSDNEQALVKAVKTAKGEAALKSA